MKVGLDGVDCGHSDRRGRVGRHEIWLGIVASNDRDLVGGEVPGSHFYSHGHAFELPVGQPTSEPYIRAPIGADSDPEVTELPLESHSSRTLRAHP
ncbi:MAG TPA: hypothetical protein VHW04_22545 [Solirubrobacteraceae bacterium]|nr:hypothetical protein [Solirubrobacteraceae bacterium]